MSGEEDSGYTILEFTRSLTTCDDKDLNIQVTVHSLRVSCILSTIIISFCTFAGWHSSCCLELELPWSIISIADQSARVPRHHQPQPARRPQWGETGPKWGSIICDPKRKCKLVIPSSSVFDFVCMFACRYIAHNLYKHSQLHVCYGHLSLNDCLLHVCKLLIAADYPCCGHNILVFSVSSTPRSETTGAIYFQGDSAWGTVIACRHKT